jgi:hypothetical protein
VHLIWSFSTRVGPPYFRGCKAGRIFAATFPATCSLTPLTNIRNARLFIFLFLAISESNSGTRSKNNNMDRYLEDMKKLEIAIKETDDEKTVKALEKAMKDLKPADYITSKSESTQQIALRKSCENALDKLELEARDYEEVSQFCAKVDKIRKSYESIEDKEFLRMTVLRFGTDAYARYELSDRDHGNWAKLRDWILVEFSSGLSILQLIGRVFDTPFETARGWKHFSILVENRLHCAEAAILKKIREKKVAEGKDKEEAMKYNPTAREILQYMGAAVVSDRIKGEDNELYNKMASQWKDCSSANEVGNSAQYLHAQSVSTDSYAARRSQFEKRVPEYPSSPRKNCAHGADCRFLRNGHCKMRHTREEVAIARNAKSRGNRYDDKRGEIKRTFHTDEHSEHSADVRDAETLPREHVGSIFHE